MEKIKKILVKTKSAYKKGFFYTFFWPLWMLKSKLFNLFKFKNVHTRYGVKCVADFDDATFRTYFFGGYGFFYSNFLKSYASNFIFIDVGANKGLYSIIAAKNPNCEKVISFEPILETFE
ncbi:MAG: hypothetical protein P8O69_11345, partial [Amylibacter sp.]|nr:hypothetical protein [Amylibacter sp.]